MAKKNKRKKGILSWINKKRFDRHIKKKGKEWHLLNPNDLNDDLNEAVLRDYYDRANREKKARKYEEKRRRDDMIAKGILTYKDGKLTSGKKAKEGQIFEFDAAKGAYVPIALSNDKLKKFRDNVRYKEEVEWYERSLVGRQRQRDKLLLKSYKKAHTRKQRIDSGFEDGYRADQLRIAKKWYNDTLGEIYKE